MNVSLEVPPALLTALRRFAHAVVANPAVYDFVQVALGFPQSKRQMGPYLRATDDCLVLEIGAGTGNWVPCLARTARYVWLDNDPQKLRGFRIKYAASRAILADANRIPLTDKSVEVGMCIAVLHHVSDAALSSLLEEFRRVVRHRAIFLDPVTWPGHRRSKLLWSFDRGSYPRCSTRLRAAVDRWFEVEHVHEYAIHHRYWVCVARPRERA